MRAHCTRITSTVVHQTTITADDIGCITSVGVASLAGADDSVGRNVM